MNKRYLTDFLLEKQTLIDTFISSKSDVGFFTESLFNLLFSKESSEAKKITLQKLGDVEKHLKELLANVNIYKNRINDIVNYFFSSIPPIYEKLLLDIESVINFDPASSSRGEVVFAYPGFFAISIYRFAHLLYEKEVPLLPRMMTEYAHQKTGIDINPGATIGEGFFIDHGTGIVVGETTIIGNNVKIYQGVTLGALNVKKEQAQKKRHPTVEDEVIIYSNATILGGKTVIGKHSVIGGNTFVTQSVKPFSMVLPEKNKIRIVTKTSD